MQETLIPMGVPKKRRSPRPPAQRQQPTDDNEADQNPSSSEEEPKTPLLVRGAGVHQVIPREATRDVLSGKVGFYLVDEREGVTYFPPKHLFVALKLDRKHVEKYEDYICLGAHQRIFEPRRRRRSGLGYRRRYLYENLINQGIYVSPLLWMF
ncbi:hypothetical protein GWI33_000937 [Rhynchophorus ferrugineus]|uniref:Uncharacterized protein n=1 Tax=Rhynchophorus ferrugineus TaxID=354439 RepID=A0A834MI82_RHYFE|nr:hypothetical protein GWI33_000937 [Rhynchophorus ferrugineus]